VLFCNAHEARALLAYHGADSHGHGPELATRLQAAGAAGVVVTGAAQSVAVADAAGRWEVPPVPAAPVDETGAGDALVAGTLAAMLAGQPLAEAVAAGTVVAALTVESEHTVRPDLSPQLVEQAAIRRRSRGNGGWRP